MIYISILIILIFLVFFVVFFLRNSSIGRKDIVENSLVELYEYHIPDCEIRKLGYSGSKKWKGKSNEIFISFNRNSGLIGSETSSLICVFEFDRIKENFMLLSQDHRYRYLDSVREPLQENADQGVGFFSETALLNESVVEFICKIRPIISKCSIEFCNGHCIILIDRGLTEKMINVIRKALEIRNFILCSVS